MRNGTSETARHGLVDGLLRGVMGPEEEGAPPPARRLALKAIICVALASASLSALHLAAAPPFTPPDETSHVGYALAVADGAIPDLRDLPDATRIPHMPGNIGLFAASHPPLAYVLAAVPLRAGEALGAPLSGLYAGRALMVVAAAVGYILLGLLGLAVLPSRPAIAVVATASAALTPYQVHLAGVLYNDAIAFAVITAQLLLAVIALRRGLSGRLWIWLVALSAIAASVRAAGVGSALLCAGVAGLATLLHGRGGWARRLGTGALRGLAIAVAALGASGWFYLRNWQRYGSLTASSELMVIHSREELGRSTLTILFERGFWRNVHSQLWGRVETYATGSAYLPHEMIILGRWLVTGLLLVLLAWGVWRIVQGAWRQPPGAVAGWLLLLGWFGVLAYAMAGFVQSGGGPHARYLWPALGVVHLGMALALAALPGGRRGLPAFAFLAFVLYANANNLVVFLLREEVPGVALGLRALALEHPAAAFAVLTIAGAAVLGLLGAAAAAIWRLEDVQPAAVAPLDGASVVKLPGGDSARPRRVDLVDVTLATLVLTVASLQLNHVFGFGIPALLLPIIALGVALGAAASVAEERDRAVTAVGR